MSIVNVIRIYILYNVLNICVYCSEPYLTSNISWLFFRPKSVIPLVLSTLSSNFRSNLSRTWNCSADFRRTCHKDHGQNVSIKNRTGDINSD